MQVVAYHKLVLRSQGLDHVLKVAGMPYNPFELPTFRFEPHRPESNHWSKSFYQFRIMF